MEVGVQEAQGGHKKAAAYQWSPSEIRLALARKEFSYFAIDAWSYVDPSPLVWGWHMDCIAEHLTWVALGQIRFLLINIPPRFSKSTLCSVLWPVWQWIDHPELQFLTASYALQLATRDSLKSRRLIQTPWFQSNWGDKFRLSPDEYLKRQYSNDRHGRRISTAVDAAVTGEGGNRLIVDDPHNARETESDEIRMGVHDWWDNAMSSRLNQQNVDSWMVIGQLTHEDDLFAHIRQREDMSQIVELVLPNEFDPARRCITVNRSAGKRFKDPRKKKGELLCDQRLDAASTKRLKRTMSESKYALQYNQDKRGGGGKIMRREFWREWASQEPPECEYIIQAWDTALKDSKKADYSARTDWGLFRWRPPKGGERLCILLFGRYKEQVPYWKLRKDAKASYQSVEPDTVLIEKKVSGISLIQDFRRLRMRVTPVSIDHGGRSKIDIKERAELAAPMLEAGLVWYMDRPWAEEVIDECAKVPGAIHDDLATTVCMALMFLRRKHEVKTWEDPDESGEVRLFKRKKSIYG